MADQGKEKHGNTRDKDGNRVVQFGNLNLLGKAVFLGGAITRIASKAVDSAIQASVDIALEAEKAFKQGLDPNIEDAKIIEEHDEKKRPANARAFHGWLPILPMSVEHSHVYRLLLADSASRKPRLPTERLPSPSWLR